MASRGLAHLIEPASGVRSDFLEDLFELDAAAATAEPVNVGSIQDHLARRLAAIAAGPAASSTMSSSSSSSVSSTSSVAPSPASPANSLRSSASGNVEMPDAPPLPAPASIESALNAVIAAGNGPAPVDPFGYLGTPDTRPGRLGPRVVKMNRRDAGGTLEYTENDLTVESHSNFSSVRANACVFRGKWMYEVTLGTEGIQQIGWAPLDCVFTNEEGVGDSVDSYAYDGKRIRKWSKQQQQYGQAWCTGDVIGCLFDADAGQLSFRRNGYDMGLAYRNVRVGARGPGLAYFPAISLSFGERATFNFGAKPLLYPVEGYETLQAPPPPALLSQAQYLVRVLRRLLPAVPALPEGEIISSIGGSTSAGSPATKASRIAALSIDDATIIAATLFQHLGPLFANEYVVVSCLYPMLRDLLLAPGQPGGSGSGSSYLARFVDLVVSMQMVERHELDPFLTALFGHLGHLCRTRVMRPGDSARERLQPLQLAIVLLRMTPLFNKVAQLPTFPLLLEHLMTIKQMNSPDLAAFFPVVWWQGCADEGSDKDQFEASSKQLQELYGEHERLVQQLCAQLMDDDAPLVRRPTPLTRQTPAGDWNGVAPVSPRMLFRRWLRYLVEKNRKGLRNVPPPGLSTPSVLVNVYFFLVHRLEAFMQAADVSAFPWRMFVDGSVDYFDYSRLGGLLSHVSKTFPIDNTARQLVHGVDLEPELFDVVMWFYYLSMSNRFKQSSIYIQHQGQTFVQLAEVDARISRVAPEDKETLEQLALARKVFRDDCVEHVRLCAYERVALFTDWKQQAMFWSVHFAVRLLEAVSAAEGGAAFHYVPELYVDAVIDTFHALRRADPPLQFAVQTPGPRLDGLLLMINFLVQHFDDKRIINPDVRDLLLQSISVLLQYPDYVAAFERPEVDRKRLMRSLLSSFESRYWITVANILLRFWRGAGFAQPQKSSDCASLVYQRTFKEIGTDDPALLNEFLNRIFNNLNWAVTEFGVSTKELSTAMSRPSTYAGDAAQVQRKVAVMFDLSVNLIRILEMTSRELPGAFLEHDMNMTRLVELLLFVINRTTTGVHSRSFDTISKYDLQTLDKSNVSRGLILRPLVGTLLNLESKQLEKALASDASLSMECMKFMLNLNWSKELEGLDGINFAGEVEDALQRLRELLDRLDRQLLVRQQHDAENEASLRHSTSADFCAICYSAVVDATFVPCGHRSCTRCIQRHLLNSRKCFFCNAPVTRVDTDSSSAIADSAGESSAEPSVAEPSAGGPSAGAADYSTDAAVDVDKQPPVGE